MKNIAIIAIVAASFAAPAFAQSASTAFAIAQFNQSAETRSDIITLPTGNNTTQVSTRGMTPLADAFAQFNQSANNPGELRGLTSATVVSGTPAYASDIFARLAAESREDN